MTIKDFRRIALGLKDTIESAHMGHPDFRIDGRLFASLHKDQQWGMVALTPDQQQEFVIHGRETFVPENGAWGRMGYTKVHLASVDEDALGRALTLASWLGAFSLSLPPAATASRHWMQNPARRSDWKWKSR